MFYDIIRTLMSPIVSFLMFIGGKKGRFFRKRLKQDFSPLKKEKYIWIHCSSVGEINLSEILIKKLMEKRNERILITIFTDTGMEVAQNKFENNPRVDLFYFPLDDPEMIHDILWRIELKFLIIIETEIWPNLIKQASEYGKVILVNGRISDRSFVRYKRFTQYLDRLFMNVSAFYMQTDEDSNRIIDLGAPSSRVETVGNLKFDIEFPEYSQEEKTNFKEFLGIGNRQVFTAGSSRSGEYETLLNVFKNLEDTVLILVPRHIERTPQIEELLKKHSYSYKKYSEINEKNIEKTDIIIIDIIGILRKVYSITDIAFVGGTLVDIGGHSLLEPLFYGKIPIFGPYLQNVKEISQEIIKYHIGYKVHNTQEFLDAIREVKKNQENSREIIDKLFKENRNTADKIIEKIEKI